MNYRHAFHAGNFADVVKHAVLALVLTHLNRKETPYRVIDTHAGLGVYDLAEERSAKTGEWRGGIGRLLAAKLPTDVAALLKPYLDVVEEVRSDLGPTFYPGSPEIARRLTRTQDRLIFVEKHPRDFLHLEETMKRDRRAKVLPLDGWTALRANVPPRREARPGVDRPTLRGARRVRPPRERGDAGLAEMAHRRVPALVSHQDRLAMAMASCSLYARPGPTSCYASSFRRRRRERMGSCAVPACFSSTRPGRWRRTRGLSSHVWQRS